MSSFLLLWIGVIVFFLIIEIATTAFYGLALAFSSFWVALYVWISGETSPSFIQGVIFVILSLVGAYWFPKLFSQSTPESPQWLDVYLGKTRKIKKVWEDLKVSLDGVDYLIEVEGGTSGSRVKIMSRNGSTFMGEILQ